MYEELEKRRGVEQRQWSPGAGGRFSSFVFMQY